MKVKKAVGGGRHSARCAPPQSSCQATPADDDFLSTQTGGLEPEHWSRVQRVWLSWTDLCARRRGGLLAVASGKRDSQLVTCSCIALSLKQMSAATRARPPRLTCMGVRVPQPAGRGGGGWCLYRAVTPRAHTGSAAHRRAESIFSFSTKKSVLKYMYCT